MSEFDFNAEDMGFWEFKPTIWQRIKFWLWPRRPLYLCVDLGEPTKDMTAGVIIEKEKKGFRIVGFWEPEQHLNDAP